jgi:tRNA uridine 5-carbamoylmethylation protein Kti12
MALDPVTIIVRGKHDSGKTTLASHIKWFLEETGFTSITVEDIPPLPAEQKPAWHERFERNKGRPIHIKVELAEDGGSSRR